MPLTPAQAAAIEQVKSLRMNGTLADEYFRAMAAQMNQMIDTGLIVFTGGIPTGLNTDLITNTILQEDEDVDDLDVDRILDVFILYSQVNVTYSGTEADRTPRATVNKFISAGV